MLGKSSSPVFRICSIGCGDGKLDRQVLTKINEKFPDVVIHFCAFDVNEVFVEHAKESLKQLDNVEVEILARDIEKVNGEFAPCDMVLCVSVLYYVKSLEHALSNVLKLVKNDGEFSISSNTPVAKLEGSRDRQNNTQLPKSYSNFQMHILTFECIALRTFFVLWSIMKLYVYTQKSKWTQFDELWETFTV